MRRLHPSAARLPLSPQLCMLCGTNPAAAAQTRNFILNLKKPSEHRVGRQRRLARTGESELSASFGEHEEPGNDMFSGLFGGFDKGKTKAHLRLGACTIHARKSRQIQDRRAEPEPCARRRHESAQRDHTPH